MLIDFRELFPRYNLKFNGALHIGGNVGEEFDVYNQLGINKQIWFEANPHIFEKLKENISSNPNARAYNRCVGDENKQVILNISNNASQSSSVLQLGTHKIAHPSVHYIDQVSVPMIRIDSVFSKIDHESDSDYSLDGIDFLNVDVQGFELNVLKGIGELLHGFKAMYLEVNSDYLYENCCLVGEIDEYVKAFGFERVETKWAGNTGWGDALFLKK